MRPKSVFTKSDQNLVWLSGKQGPDSAEWQAYTDAILELAATLPGPEKLVRILVVTDGGGPSSTQRTDLIAALGTIRVRTAVLSCSTFVRGIATVFNWFNVENKVFAPKDVIRALEFVGVGASTRGSAWSTVEGLARQLGQVETVDAARPFLRGGSADELRAR